MARVKRGVTTHARHQKVIKAAKGYYGARKNLFTVATQAVERLANMRIGIVEIRNAILGVFGYKELMQVLVYMA